MRAVATIIARKEFLSGLFVLALAGGCFLAIGDLDVGSVQDMGPGYVPTVLAWLMLASGIAMTIASFWSHERPEEGVHWRPLAFVSVSLVVFGLLVDRYGIVLAVVASTLTASFASPISRLRETPVLCAALAALGAVAFVKGLGLAIPIWPR